MQIFSKKPKTKVLFIASEAGPFIKAGGLGEVMFSLPRALKDIGYDARVMIPKYAGVNQDDFKLTTVYEDLDVPTDRDEDELDQPKYLTCNVKEYESEEGNERAPVTTYFLENQEYYENRANVYGYGDDAIRWALLGRGALEFFRLYKKWTPDIIIAADWQGAFTINYLKTVYKDDPQLRNIATVFSIHNIFYQGMFDYHFVSEMDYDAGQSDIPSFFDPRLLKLNTMRRGIIYADVVNTVSPTYSQEIMTEEYGELLDKLLRERRSSVYGIINGIDYETINPETDPHLVKTYNANNLANRTANKEELQSRFGLEVNPDSFLVGIVSRLDGQKGFNLLFDTLELFIRELDMQLVVVGNGSSEYMNFFSEMGKKYPKKVAPHLKFDIVLPHLVFGAADALLIPSKFEPSGLTQMEAMRFGCVPIVRKTGGLADTVEDYNPVKNSGTGFVFEKFDSLSLVTAVTRAYENYRHHDIWKDIQKRGMAKDFSWKHSALEYERIIKKAVDIRNRTEEGAEF
jgi:starch synthase